jgi:hypothetical protein
MMDLAMLALTVVSFTLAMTYASFCDHLLALPAGGGVTS